MKSRGSKRTFSSSLREKIIEFSTGFESAMILDSNPGPYSHIPVTGIRYEFMAALGVRDEIKVNHNALLLLKQFLQRHRSQGNFVFGSVSYDLKNEIESLESVNPGYSGFPVMHFFVPIHLFLVSDGEVTVISAETNPEELIERAESVAITKVSPPELSVVHVTGREEYFDSVRNLLRHIQNGDVYEVNLCHQVLLKARHFDPSACYKKLNAISPNPFSAFYRCGESWLLSASPERFVAKKGNRLISQPVKGTAGRRADATADHDQKQMLRESEKERSENVMIVDLVRNDLSKIARRATVKVDELCGVYSFTRAHQMISTVSCEVNESIDFTDVLQALFPMGSMTGAPKISALKLIERYENFKRELFSGTVGYVDPSGDFDFNVVIRSILYNEETDIVCLPAGGAITAASDPEKEFLETIIKLSPQLEALGLDTSIFNGIAAAEQNV